MACACFTRNCPKFLQCQGCSRSILSGMCPVRTSKSSYPLPPIPFPLNRFRTLFASAAHNGTRIPLLFFHLQTLCRHNRGALQRHTLQRNNMIEKTDNSNSVNQLSLCRHRTVSGRRCRLRVLNPESHLCFRHAQLRQKKRRAEDLACDLAGQLTEFTSAADINSFLSRLLLLQAHDRIAPRRAAVMAYTCNLLLRTLPAIGYENELQAGPPRLEAGTIPRPGQRRPNRDTDP